jgi:hypothetical protein
LAESQKQRVSIEAKPKLSFNYTVYANEYPDHLPQNC